MTGKKANQILNWSILSMGVLTAFLIINGNTVWL